MAHRASRSIFRAQARRTVALLGASSLVGLAGAGALHAQERAEAGPSAPISEIVVTGTNIKGVAPVGSPVIPMTRADMERTGLATTADMLKEIPQVLTLGSGNDYSGGSPVQNSTLDTTFAKSPNLRGLGQGATLSLVDGHRVPYVGANMNLFDADIIPSKALERVEVVADGASAIYGADAVGGVVNYILRKPFQGAETSVRYGWADGAQQWQASQVVGLKWNNGGIMAAYEHQHFDALEAAARPNLYTNDYTPFGGPPPSDFASPGNVVIGGVDYAIPHGQNGQNLTLAGLGAAGVANRQNVWQGTQVTPETRRDSFVWNAEQRVSDWLEFFTDGDFSYRTFSINQWSTSAALRIPNTNPYSPCNPAHAPSGPLASACSSGSLTVNYNFLNDYGPSNRAGYDRAYFAHGGFRIHAPHDWTITAQGGYGRDDGYYYQVAQGVRPTPAALNQINVFCDGSAFTCNAPSVLASIRSDFFVKSAYINDIGSVNASGPLVTLPGGDIRLAIGYEYNRDTLQTDNTFGPGRTGLRTIGSEYAELYVPLVGAGNAVPLVRKLELTLAGRISNYNDVGVSKNPKIGINYTPVEGFKLHASYGTSFRAPTLNDLDPNGAHGYLDYFVPGSAVNAALCASCSTANGLQALFDVGGRAQVQPETAKTWSIGFDLTPPQLSGLSVSVNYYNVKYTGKIDTPTYNVGAAPAINAGYYDGLIIYNPAFFPTKSANNPVGTCPNGPTAKITTQALFDAELACISSFSDGPVLFGSPSSSNLLAILDGRRYNSGIITTQGLDLSAHYMWDTRWGQMRAGAIGTYIISYKVSPIPTAPLSEQVNHFGYPLRFRARGEVGLDHGPWSVTGYLNFTNAYSVDPIYLPAGVSPNYQHVSAYTTFDLSVSYDLGSAIALRAAKGTRIMISAQNLFDTDPPLLLNNGTDGVRFDPQNASPMGRTVAVEITKRW